MTRLERLIQWFAPSWAASRARARTLARHYDAASQSRRTSNWRRRRSDADTANAIALAELRGHARDLVRNNAWAKRGVNVVVNNTVSWGAQPQALGANAAQAQRAWEAWARSTSVETEGRRNFAGLQALVMRTVVVSGECLVRRRPRRQGDGLALPLQLQVIEPDYLDTDKTLQRGFAGGPVIQGVEFDAIGRRAAYWLFDTHPGSSVEPGGVVSRRVPVDSVLHIYDDERPEQTRGVSWLGASIVNLKDLDEYEDAELMKQKIAACFAAFVTDTEGTASPIGDNSADPLVETLEPGMVHHLPPGKNVQFGNPPTMTSDAAMVRTLRKIAAGLGVTYEDLTGDYSQVNFSSARMGRLAHQANVVAWQNQILIPQLCQPVWRWVMEAAQLAGQLQGDVPESEWVAPALPMVDPVAEGKSYTQRVRSGLMTVSQMIREQGYEPRRHLAELAADFAQLDELKLKLDIDPRAVSQQGQAQVEPSATPSAERVEEDVDLSDLVETNYTPRQAWPD